MKKLFGNDGRLTGEPGKEKAGGVILNALRQAAMSGQSWLHIVELKTGCMKAGWTAADFEHEWKVLVGTGNVLLRGDRVYLAEIARYENLAGEAIAARLLSGKYSIKPELPLRLNSGGRMLDAQQRSAVEMALSHPVSMILGGAGCGKTTIIGAIAKYRGGAGIVACAPTGKAARNLRERTGLNGGTVHEVLGVKPEESFLDGGTVVEWKNIGIVVVDECSMLTVEMLAGLLSRAVGNCRIVLIGDPGQLPAVGPGNVIADLVAAGVPQIRLTQGYRQSDRDSALWYNVRNFDQLRRADELEFDSSFVFVEAEENEIPERVWALYHGCLERGEEAQVLSPVNSGRAYAVDTLNREIQSRLNGPLEGKAEYKREDVLLRDADRILITRNNWTRGCVNGDVGRLRLRWRKGKLYGEAELESGNVIPCDKGLMGSIKLAYAMTVHKSQGSQYHTVILPVCCSCGMMNRNLFYTAISRATDRVILVGERTGLNMAMMRRSPPRRSGLAEAVRGCLRKTA